MHWTFLIQGNDPHILAREMILKQRAAVNGFDLVQLANCKLKIEFCVTNFAIGKHCQHFN